MSVVESERDCRELVVRSIRALDGREYDIIAGAFAEDGVWERGGEQLVGPRAVRDALDKRPAELETQHLVSNLVVDMVSENVAVVRYTLCAYAQTADAAYHLHAIFKATDHLGRTPDGWRFANRAVQPAFSPRG